MHEFLKDDYNLDALARVRPAGDGFDMYVTPRFVPVYADGYEVLTTRIVKRLVARKDLFIDVGAHYGYYSLLAAEANPALRVVAVEPIADNLQVLKKNLALNGLGPDRAACLQAAMSSQAGRASFCKSEASDNGSLYPHPSSETLDRIEVDTTCLDDVVGREKGRRIFVKTDTDGHELEVLKGFAKTLETCEDVTILLEMNPKMMKISGTSAGEIVAYLHGQGFRLFAIDDREARFYPLDLPVNVAMMEARYEKSYYNVLCVRKSAALSVLFFSHAANLAGAERSLLDLVRGLSERGILCTAVLPAHGPLRSELVKLGCATYVPPDDAIFSRGWWWANIPPGPSRAAIATGAEAVTDVLIPEIGTLAPDVIFSQTIVSPWGALCAEILKVSHVLSAREYGILDHGMAFLMGFRESMDALYASSEAVFCITSDVKEALFGADADRKAEVVYSSIRPEDVQPKAKGAGGAEEIPKADPAVPTLGIFGTIAAGKGHGDLIRACLDLARRGIVCRCLLAGSVVDEEYAATLRREIDESGFSDRFVWAGFVDDPYVLMRQVDLLVSCSRKEALGRTLIEAALLGRPIVYANSGGPREIFTAGEHGLAYEPGDVQDLARTLEAALQDRAATAERARKAKEYVLRRFSDEAYAGKIGDRLRRIARQPGRSARHAMAVAGLMTEFGIGTISIGRVQPKLLFAEEGDDFVESRSVPSPETPFGPFDLTFSLPDRGYPRLRFDPTELYPVSLAIYAMEFAAEDGTVLDPADVEIETNGDPTGDRAWQFRTLDPQVVLRPKRRVKSVRIVGELKKVLPGRLLRDLDIARRECETHRQALLHPERPIDSTLFIDDGTGYGEKNKVVVQMDFQPSSNGFSVEFRLPAGAPAGRKLRWDPCEGRFCRCRIDQVETDGVYRGIGRRNAWKTEDGWDEFMTGDPIYELEGDWAPATFIRISGGFALPETNAVADRFKDEWTAVRRECESKRREIHQMGSALDAVRRECKTQRQELAGILASRSWRWTHLLRRLDAWLGRRFAPPGTQKP